MIKKKFRLPVLLVIFLILLISRISLSQTFSKFGFKGGVSIVGLTSYNNNGPTGYLNQHSFINDSSTFFNFLSFDIAVFGEFFSSKQFCLSAEVHYLIKASSSKVRYTVPNYVLAPEGNYWEYGYLDDKIQYLSFMLLPRFRMPIAPPFKGNVYIFAGPAFDFMLKDLGSYTQPGYIKKDNTLNNIGGVFGIGFEWQDYLTFEFRGEHDFTGPYNFKYKNDEIARRYTTFTFLLGISIYKHKK